MNLYVEIFSSNIKFLKKFNIKTSSYFNSYLSFIFADSVLLIHSL